MFEKILIANRGEIACRVARTARRLGIRVIAVYSDADAQALHVAVADEAHHIGPSPPRHSYLAIDRILDVAVRSGAQAIHPGYGFLSENPDFADACAAAGIAFIGPPPQAIRAMGSKSAAKALMATAEVPIVPGYHGAAQDMLLLERAAAEIGFPLLIKASAGGGGRGMRVVRDGDAFAAAVESARRESMGAFGDDALLLERYLERARHVEVQVLADRSGRAVHLFERDCSLQRRHQKVLEEAPAPNVDPALRHRMGAAAVAAARAVGYEGAGTVEFLLADDGQFYFMEMNTRLQVEHGITEMITGLDLVEWQIRVAAGEVLAFTQDDLAINGHAFEARLCAEDPARDFVPGAGVIRHLRFPEEGPEVRVDTGVRQGDVIGVDYDSLIAKLIVWGHDRTAALVRLRRALDDLQLVGPPTNAAFLAAVAAHPAFAGGAVDTSFLERHHGDLVPAGGPASPLVLALACLHVLLRRDAEVRAVAARSPDPYSPWHSTAGWRLNDDNFHVLTFRDGDAQVAVTIHYRPNGIELELPDRADPLPARGAIDDNGDVTAEVGGTRVRATVVRHGSDMVILAGGGSHRLSVVDAAERAQHQEASGGTLTAPMPGKIVDVLVQPGQTVSRGTTLLVLEAMKMEHAVTAPADGTIAGIRFRVGDQVEDGAVLISFADQ